jgi:hypothetical protein
MALTVTVEGLDGVQTWLTNVAKGLEHVPEKFSAREDVKRDLEDVARLSLDMFGIEDTGTAKQNIRAESTPQHDGIVVFEALNEATKSKYGPGAGRDPYIVFFLEEYAGQSFLKPKGVALGRDFYRLWPDMMRTIVVTAFDEEVNKELRR